MRALEGNFKALNVGPEGRIVIGDAWQRGGATPEGRPFDLVLLDPLYADSEDTSPEGPVGRFLRGLAKTDQDAPLVVLHHRSTVRFPEETDAAWRIVDSRTYGTNTVTFFER